MRPGWVGFAVALAIAGAWASGARAADPAQQEISAADYDRAAFDDDSADVDNRWFPLEPGTQWIYKGSTMEGQRRVRHRVITTVTDLTKVIDGVRNVVLWDRDYSGGELVEAELAFFAQDHGGNVWHLGQYPEEYERGKFVKAPAWIHGLKGARAGIFMKARPRLGTPSYAQGFGPDVQWFDRARVYKKGVRTCVPAGCYRNVLVTDEYAQDEPQARQLKYYAPGVGNVRVGWRGKDTEKETLALVKVRRLAPGGLARARQEAMKLEAHAYRISEDVYGQTPPAQRAPVR